MSALSRGVATALLLALPCTAGANGHLRSSVSSSYYYYPPAVSSYYYYPVPLAVMPAVPAVYAAPVAVPAPVAPAPVYAAPPPAYAPPAPACPSPAPLEPPMPPARPAPAVSESPSQARAPAVTTTAAKPSPIVQVSFWNYSNQDVTLRVDGQARILARGRGLTLDMPREFVWQVNDRTEETERVPAEKPGVQIVIGR